MKKSLVITLIGDDRPGIVETIAEIVVEHQGQWVESRMANLSGKFAGILRVSVPIDEVEGLTNDLNSPAAAGLNVTVAEVADESTPPGKSYRLELVGQDRPGIVHRISSALAQNGATVEDLESEVIDASMSGEKLFKATITMMLAEGYNIDDLSEILEDLANELIVDIELD